MHQFTTLDFANAWTHAWNSRDLPAILAHYDDDCVLHTPVAKWLAPGSEGVLVGKSAMAAYWARALQRPGEWQFALTHVHTGVNSVAMSYEGPLGAVTEFCVFNAHNLVCQAHVMYDPDRLLALFRAHPSR